MVNRFSKISISGYRRLLAIEDLEMRPFTVMIGANGVGKTSVLEVFTLLATSAKGELKNIISDLGGFRSLLTCDKTDSMSFKLAMKMPKYAPLEYSLSLGTQGISYEITHEELLRQPQLHDKPFKYIDSQRSYIQYWNPEKQQLTPPNWDYQSSETALSQSPKMYPEPEQMRQQLSSCTIYSAYTLDLRRHSPVRLPQQLQPETQPGPNGEYLISCLYNLRETDRARFEVIEDTLAVAFRGFKRLNFPAVAAGMLAITWEDENFSRPLYMDQLSEGTLRFLWLVTLLYSPNLAAVTLIDEPEVSLHPELLGILCDAMRDAVRSTHLIVATHSDRLIGFLEPKEVLVLDHEESMTKMTWADSEKFDLDNWLKNYSLAELWQMGRIGEKSMEIMILVEGRTEEAFSMVLRDFLRPRLANNMPHLDFFPYNGRIPTAEKLKRAVENGLRRHEAVIALTDVYTGMKDFKDANDAKHKMRQWVGNEPQFYPHVALHDFEAWLIPYWPIIQKLAGHNKAKPSDNPEQLNHNKPPSYYVKEIFEVGTR